VFGSVPNKGLLLHYDRRGNFTGTLGRIGDGPGEYRWTWSVVRARGDSISIMAQGRIATISTVTGRGRSEKVPPNLDGHRHAVLGDGTVIVNVGAQYQQAFGALTPVLALKKQFGPQQQRLVLTDQGGRTIGDERSTMSALAPSLTGGVWTTSLWYEHHLQHYNGDGVLITDVRRHPAWFPPYTYADLNEKLYRVGELRVPALPRPNGIGVDSGGHVFVVSRVADANWKKDPKAPPPPPPAGEYPAEKLQPTGGIDRYVDSILEMYDDKVGTFLGSWRSDVAFESIMQNGLLYTQAEAVDGLITIKVYRIRVASGK
jgi:hypothetical protein